MTNDEIIAAVIEYAVKQYGAKPEHPWAQAPCRTVLRHDENGKWYALITDIANSALSLPGDGRTDIMDLRCSPAEQDAYLREGCAIPSRRVKQVGWVTVLLDGSVKFEKVRELLDISYQITLPNPISASFNKPWFGEKKDSVRFGRAYFDEAISVSPEREKNLPPKEYGELRKMSDSHYSHELSVGSDELFYRQAKFMENFEDDCPYKKEVLRYYPTYRSLTLPELRGYFTWRTRWRRGEKQKTSLSYAFLYIYELLHLIGSKTKEEGLEKLLGFYEDYSAFDPRIKHHTEQWIADFAVYYDLPPESVGKFLHLDFDNALLKLQNCGELDDETLFAAISELSPYNAEKSKLYKKYPDEFMKIVCRTYRKINEGYEKRYKRPYTQKLWGEPEKFRYFPFGSAVFYMPKREGNYTYTASPLQRYFCEKGEWKEELGYLSAQRSPYLGQFVRAADRLSRDAYGLKPSLKPGAGESKTALRRIKEAIEDLREELREAAKPKIEFDLSKLSGIRKSSETVGQALMTEEERYVEETPAEKVPARVETAAECVLSGNELRFAQLLLYGGDLKKFLTDSRLMASVLAEAVNEKLYDEFADTVIEFDGDNPVVVEDYIEDLKGMIPS